MRHIVFQFILSILILACGNNQPSAKKAEVRKSETVKTLPAQSIPGNEMGMWKVASYAGDLGDNKNSSYITNTYAIWGSYSNSTVDHSEVKVKFMIDKVSFCIKLYEYGKKIVRKGDETCYNFIVKQDGNEPVVFSARNVSDRIFIPEVDARKIVELFNKGERITFSMANDSKINPSNYVFVLDLPGGFNEAMKKLSH